MAKNYGKKIEQGIVIFFALIGIGISLLFVYGLISEYTDWGKGEESLERSSRERFVYDPDKCSTDAHGMMHFAYGDKHFQLSPEAAHFPYWIAIKEIIEKTGSTEHMGCPLNPVRDYYVFITIDWPLATPKGTKDILAPKDQNLTFYLMPVRQGNMDAAFQEKQTAIEAAFDRTCKQYKKIKTYENGLVGCLITLDSPSGNYEFALYQADSRKYATPLGAKLTLESSFQNTSAYYHVKYLLTENVLLDYGFSSSEVLPENIIPLDMAIRKKALDILDGKETLE